MRFIILGFAFASLMLTSCSDDDDGGSASSTEAVVFTSTIQPAKASNTTDDEVEEWSEMRDQRIGVEMDGVVKTYYPDDDGTLSSSDPFYWEGRTSASANAWYPYNNGVKHETVVVKAQQNIEAYYQLSNLMETAETEVTPEDASLVFVHRTSKLSISLASLTGSTTTRADDSSLYDTELVGATLTLLNMQGVETGTSIQMTSNYRAYICPQTVVAGVEFLEVELQDGRAYTYTLPEDLVTESAVMYDVDLTVDVESGEMTMSVTQLPEWDGSDEDVSISVDSLGSDTSSSWAGSSGDTSTSNASSTDMSADTSSWTSSGSDTSTSNASSTSTGTSSSWAGSSSEESTSNASSTDTSADSSGWTGTSDTSTSNASSTETDTSSSWTGTSESTTSNASSTETDTNSSWSGTSEESTSNVSSTTTGTSSSWTDTTDDSDVTSNVSSTTTGTSSTWTDATNGESASGTASSTTTDTSSTWTDATNGESASGTASSTTTTTSGSWTSGNSEEDTTIQATGTVSNSTNGEEGES